jgi:hypothetical protein
MKKHLVSLLMLEYLHLKMTEKVERSGFIKIEWIANYDIWSIVVDMVGFPKDNTPISEFFQNSLKVDADNDEMFCRDWLMKEWFRVCRERMPEPEIIFNHTGLCLADKESEAFYKGVIGGYVDWLYKEFNDWNKQWTDTIIANSIIKD